MPRQPQHADVPPEPASALTAKRYGAAAWAPNFTECIYPAHKIAVVVNALGKSGVQAAALLAGTGLMEDQLKSATTRVSYQQTSTVLRNALQLSPDPAFALRAGQLMRVTSYGMYGYALMSSPSHEVALEFAHKYHLVMGPVARMSAATDSGGVLFTYDPILAHDPQDALYRACVEFVVSSHFRLNRDLYGPAFRFAQIRLAYPAPAHARAYRQLFGCSIEFGQARNEVRLDAAWMVDPTPYSDPITNAMALETCEAVLGRLHQAKGLAGRIRQMLIEHPGRFPNVEATAAQLSMSPRMLHRKLEAEQTTYRKLLAEVRMNLAIEYLRKTTMTNEDIAARLGYSDAANFRHAFFGWTGKRPSDYRV